MRITLTRDSEFLVTENRSKWDFDSLTEIGIKQSKIFAKRLGNESFEQIYTSSLQKAYPIEEGIYKFH